MPGQQNVGQRVFTEVVPRQPQPQPWLPGGGQWGGVPGAPVPNFWAPTGITGMPVPDWTVSAGFTRRFAEFEFKTGVNSILQWDNMIINEIGFRVDHNFNLRDVPLFVFGEYRRGSVVDAGLSMDFDLMPFDPARPDVGIFTISIGGTSGNTDSLRIGVGARHAWNWNGWKFSPSFGYEIFRHNLRMHDHIYPNPGVFLPMLTEDGHYVFGDRDGNFWSVPIGTVPNPEWYQVCLTPEDIMVAQVGPNGQPIVSGGELQVIGNPSGQFPNWGVGPGNCIVIGGDGMIQIPGVTHIYNTTWSGFFVGLEVEKQMTFRDRLRFYFQAGLPRFYAEGTWPHRTDWQQNPSFIDRGSNGAFSYVAEMEYIHQISERLKLSLRVDTNFFRVGQIGGELFLAGFPTYRTNEDGSIWFNPDPNSPSYGLPQVINVPPQTLRLSDALKYAQWQSFGLRLGITYLF